VAEDSLDGVLGVVKAKDLLLADLKNGTDLRQIVRPPIHIPETAFGSRALEMFRESKRELMLVVDEFGVVQGLITLADILEEIVGAFEGGPQATSARTAPGYWMGCFRMMNSKRYSTFGICRMKKSSKLWGVSS